MVAYLEKSTKNDDFAQIVDFLSAYPIRVKKLERKRESKTLGSDYSIMYLYKKEVLCGRIASKHGRNVENRENKGDAEQVTTAGVSVSTTKPITTASVNITTAEPTTPPTTTTIFEDEDLIIAQTLIKDEE
ncbi:hypothetical protein Tco_0772475 [Tanacetum coccineum]|uniref:Uncharacterized protein n=1 Tax=Tanacetum coccineum TaxID=301880 RepID=A0ABQ4ZHZ8_9ASTR